MSDYTLLCNGILLDGTGSEPQEGMDVLIKGKYIEEILPHRVMKCPQDTKIVDCKGMVIMPGLIDAHLHLFGRKVMSHTVQICEDPILRGMRSVLDAWRLIDAGYTTVRDCTSGNGIALRNYIAEGEMVGPRILACGLALSQTGGHGELMHSVPIEFSNRGLTCRLADGVSEVRKGTREQIRAGADFIKIYTSGGVMSEYGSSEECQYSLEEIRACTEEARNRGLRTASHSQGRMGIINAAKGGVDSIEHGVYMDDEGLELILKNKCFLVPTISIFNVMKKKGAQCGMPDYKIRKAEKLIEVQLKSFRRAYEAGVICGLGSDFLSDDSMTPMGANIIEVVDYVERAGLSIVETIKCATCNNAKILNLDHITGTVEKGKYADILLVDDELLNNIRVIADRTRIRKIFKEGEAIPRLEIKKFRRFESHELFQ